MKTTKYSSMINGIIRKDTLRNLRFSSSLDILRLLKLSFILVSCPPDSYDANLFPFPAN